MAAIAATGALSLPICSPRSCDSNSYKKFQGIKMVFRVFSEFNNDSSLRVKNRRWITIFDVEDPRSNVPQREGNVFTVDQALELARYNIRYCDWRARQDLLSIMLLHEKVHISEARVSAYSSDTIKQKLPRKHLDVSGPVELYHPRMKNFWYPVAFSADLKADTMIPIDCFEEPWVLFRGKDGNPGCVRNTCAHRACPLHLGSVNEGRIRCPYHGWEYATDGKCEKMPSTRLVDVKIRSLPCFEQEGLIWIWPGDEPPTATIPSLQPPSEFEIHAEFVTELPVEHGLLLDNLLDIVHAPFVHTATFANGWTVPSSVKFLATASGLRGYWDPYPIAMEFRPPCMMLSTIGISKPGKLEGQSTTGSSKHLHQLFVCIPSSRNKTRLLSRMSLDFAPVLKHIPFIHYLWRHFTEQVLNEDLRLMIGQQERMINGANVWNFPVDYDKLGFRYRLWRKGVEEGGKRLPFS